MTDYTAVIRGTWDPGGIPAFTDALEYSHAQQEARAAVRTLLDLGDNALDFHIVGVDGVSGRVQRERWHVEAFAGGPALRMGSSSAAHPSEIALTARLHPHSEVQQVWGEPDRTLPYAGVLAGVVPALLLRARFGVEPRHITVGGLGTGTFTPELLSYPDLYGPQIIVPIDTADLASYLFVQGEDIEPHPALWLVAEEGSWKISYCVTRPDAHYTERWDDPDEPTPDFEPLPHTAD